MSLKLWRHDLFVEWHMVLGKLAHALKEYNTSSL